VAIRNAICKAGEADLTTVFHLTYWMHALTFSLRPSCICILFFEYHGFSAMQEPCPSPKPYPRRKWRDSPLATRERREGSLGREQAHALYI
jgi:hypothetical protein